VTDGEESMLGGCATLKEHDHDLPPLMYVTEVYVEMGVGSPIEEVVS